MEKLPLPRPLTRILSEEHALLRRALSAFARYAHAVGKSEDHDPALLGEFLHFFRDFGDRRHHDEEERLLFTWLESRGLPARHGPLLVLRHEHELCRDLGRSLALAARTLEGDGGDTEARLRFFELAVRYVELFLAHMEKEERVLFPLAERLAHASGGAPLYSETVPEREQAWVGSAEASVAGLPLASLSSFGLGTADGFERLCEEALGSPT